MKKICKKCNVYGPHYLSNRCNDGMRNPCIACHKDKTQSNRVSEIKSPAAYRICKGCGKDKPPSSKAYCSECKDAMNSVCKVDGCNNPLDKTYTAVKPKYCTECNTLHKRYNITSVDKKKLYEEQDGKCKICLTAITYKGQATHIDHSHTTNEVRGILCNKCNQALGLFHDDTDNLNRAITYLNR
jgi:hypothetical protein